jgi:hypothetical protein
VDLTDVLGDGDGDGDGDAVPTGTSVRLGAWDVRVFATESVRPGEGA